ncbi:MAG TPA: SPOR domain-containing protein [Lentimicrobium sp.]|nr:SPOR domain-containing protein [Lentimicrobium sp.]
MTFRTIILLLLCSNVVFGQQTNIRSATDHCPSPEEKKLYNLISEYRISKQLPAIQLSQSLSYVARVHAVDLSQNRPDFGGCNPHSWSDKGNWKACCYAEDENRLACMTLKPKELTSYKFKAYEAVYSGTEDATATDAFALWKEISLTSDLLLNTGKWAKPWLAMGVGIYGQYACVWFGEGADHNTGFSNCNDSGKTDTLPADNTLSDNELKSFYFIITSSAGTLPQAKQEVQRLISLGYKNASYLQNAAFYRIAISHFKDEISAYKELENIKIKFPGAWLLKPQL